VNDLADAALAYLDAGLHLLALRGKRPNIRFHPTWDWDNSIHGVPENDADMHALEEVFDCPTTTGVAILIPQNVLVADVDTEEAAVLLMQLAGSLPDTRTGRTPNGLHLWFLSPGADANVWIGGRTLLFKGFGGYVVAPPSDHFDAHGNLDGVYTWIGDWGPIDWLPEGVEERLKFTRAMKNVKPVKIAADLSGEFIQVEFTTDASGMPDGKWRLWKRWHIEGLCKAIIDAPDGNQNNVICWAAMQARDEGVPFDLAMPQLLAAAIAGGHPADRAKTTIKGAYKRGHRG